MAARLATAKMHASSSLFGVLPSGAHVGRITLANAASGLSVDVLTFGATLHSVKVPSKATGPQEVTLNYGDLEAFRAKARYYGSTIGRVGNRIAGGKFVLGDKVRARARGSGGGEWRGARGGRRGRRGRCGGRGGCGATERVRGAGRWGRAGSPCPRLGAPRVPARCCCSRTSWPPTTAPTACTAASWAGTRSTGRRACTRPRAPWAWVRARVWKTGRLLCAWWAYHFWLSRARLARLAFGAGSWGL